MRIIFSLCIAYGLFFGSAPLLAAPLPQPIRTANYFLHAGVDFPRSQYKDVANYDLVVLPMEAAAYNRDFFSYARKQNPHIVILAYVPARSINITDIDDSAKIRKNLLAITRPEWYLKKSDGSLVSAWPGTLAVDVTSPWNATLPFFVAHTIMTQKVWDGIFYDEWDDDICHLGKDIVLSDATAEQHESEQTRAWREGNVKILKNTRALLGNDIYIVINGSSLPEYQPYINGRMYEDFPTPWQGSGSWSDVMTSYLWMQDKVVLPRLFIINGIPSTPGIETDYQRMRFTLTSALLGDAYFSYDPGHLGHGSLWRYDEYAARLGKPLAPPWLAGTAGYQEIIPGVWRRDFEYGIVVVNATNIQTTIELGGVFQSLKGFQDPLVNHGGNINRVSLKSEDGIILLRKK